MYDEMDEGLKHASFNRLLGKVSVGIDGLEMDESAKENMRIALESLEDIYHKAMNLC